MPTRPDRAALEAMARKATGWAGVATATLPTSPAVTRDVVAIRAVRACFIDDLPARVPVSGPPGAVCRSAYLMAPTIPERRGPGEIERTSPTHRLSDNETAGPG